MTGAPAWGRLARPMRGNETPLDLLLELQTLDRVPRMGFVLL